MDKSRDLNARPEIINRLDAMVKAGWSVGRTWGFSLGSGLTDGPLGNVIADPTKVLETAPGEQSLSELFCFPLLTRSDLRDSALLLYPDVISRSWNRWQLWCFLPSAP